MSGSGASLSASGADSRVVFLIWFVGACSVVAVIGMSFSSNVALM